MRREIVIPEMKTISETSKIVGLAKYHIRQLVLQGKVKFVRSGVKYLLNMDSLITYLNNGDNAKVTVSNSSRKIKGGLYD